MPCVVITLAFHREISALRMSKFLRPGSAQREYSGRMRAYMDNAATTPLRPEALSAMLPAFSDRFGNPSGVHSVSRDARRALEDSRETVANLLGAAPSEVVFTSGGTESDNMAILGVGGRRGKVVTTAVEHAAVRESCNSLGAVVVPVSSDGVVNLDALASELSSDVSLVSVMLVNNEVGVVQPLAEVAALVREKAPGALLHTDAVQAFAWLDVADLVRVADLVSVSAHKFGGPKGTGALVVRDGASIRPVMFGGGHERGRRPGTQNVAGALGMAAAMAATVATRDETLKRVSALRDRLADGILSSMDGVVETGARDLKVAGNCHLRFDGVEGEALLVLLDEMGVSASAGSACSSGATEASHVLLAMGLTREEASSSVRLSLGYATSRDEVDLSLEVIPKAVSQLRRSPG